MLDYGTKIVAGVTPGRGGAQVQGVPVYDTIDDAVKKHSVNASIIFVPAPFVADATFEALDAQIETVVIITEHVAVKDSIQIIAHAKECGTTIIGPNTPGIITPKESKIGIMPAHVFRSGDIGVASRSGTLTYEVASGLSAAGLGQSTCVGLGGDPVVGLGFADVLAEFEEDEQTKAVVLIGEIGGNLEEQAAEFILAEAYSKPVVAFIAGRTAPTGKRMGHAGAIVMGRTGTAQSKIDAFTKAHVEVAEKPSDISRLLTDSLKKKGIFTRNMSET